MGILHEETFTWGAETEVDSDDISSGSGFIGVQSSGFECQCQRVDRAFGQRSGCGETSSGGILSQLISEYELQLADLNLASCNLKMRIEQLRLLQQKLDHQS